MRVLTLDVGSSSIKAGLWIGGQVRAHARVPVRTEYRGVRVEVPAAPLLRALGEAARAVLRKESRPEAIAFCTFSSGVIVAKASGQPLTPIITHADRRSVEVAQGLVRERSRRWWLSRTGNLPYPGGIGSSTLAWLSRESPGLFRGDCRAGQVSSFLAHHLTGQWVIDPSQAAFLGLMDIRTGEWSREVCEAVGIDAAALPEIRFADAVIGGVEPRIARDWGIAAGIPVVGGFVDTSAAVIQTPMTPGQLAHSAGSTDVLAMCVERPTPAEGLLARPVGTGRVFANRWLMVRTIAAAGSAIQWARTTLFPGLEDAAWRRLLRSRRLDRPGTVMCRPTFIGERAQLTAPLGASFSGVGLNTTREELLDAILRGLVEESVISYTRLAALRRPAALVYSMGGASALAPAMHAAWGRTGGERRRARHRFRRLAGESLRGLDLLARKTLNSA